MYLNEGASADMYKQKQWPYLYKCNMFPVFMLVTNSIVIIFDDYGMSYIAYNIVFRRASWFGGLWRTRKKR